MFGAARTLALELFVLWNRYHRIPVSGGRHECSLGLHSLLSFGSESVEGFAARAFAKPPGSSADYAVWSLPNLLAANATCVAAVWWDRNPQHDALSCSGVGAHAESSARL